MKNLEDTYKHFLTNYFRNYCDVTQKRTRTVQNFFCNLLELVCLEIAFEGYNGGLTQDEENRIRQLAGSGVEMIGNHLDFLLLGLKKNKKNNTSSSLYLSHSTVGSRYQAAHY